MEKQYFYTKLPFQKIFLRQIEWEVQNWTITKNVVLPVAILFFSKFCFSIRTSYNELIWYANDSNVHIETSRSAGVLFGGTFSMWVFLMVTLCISWYYVFGGINDKLLQKIYFLKKAQETCKPNNRDLNFDWIIHFLIWTCFV